MKEVYDVIVIGGGPAGLAAAISAQEKGASVLLLERNTTLGGILNQCIHAGFGLTYFKEELTGPEYAARFIDMVNKTPAIEVITGAMVLEVTVERVVRFINKATGYASVKGRAIVLAMGCRERPRGAIEIPGTRPAGILTAGAAQLYMNIEGLRIGSRVVILGSGDIGLIMARRLTLEGAKVLGVYEVMPYSSGLTRNLVQCLDDYNIPLHLSHTITEIRGDQRVEQLIVQKVDNNRTPIAGTEEIIDCDTVLLSVGLIPENELSRKAGVTIDPKTSGPVVYENMETNIPGIFAAGNVAHVHDLVDFVSAEATKAGTNAAAYAAGNTPTPSPVIEMRSGNGVGALVPQRIRPANVAKYCEVFLRVTGIYKASTIEVAAGDKVLKAFPRERLTPGEMEKIVLTSQVLEQAAGQPLTVSVKSNTKQTTFDTHWRVDNADGTVGLVCIGCPRGCRLTVDTRNNYAVTGNACDKGAAYGRQEVSAPERNISSTVILTGGPLQRLPVKTNAPIAKGKIAAAMRALDGVTARSVFHAGGVVVENAAGTGVDFVCTRTL
jgi:NADPH-dependent 2,4-dienoyl-CoA reductase/sulfur reductase-like enzyme/CxxC motif-containing protein